MLLMGSAVLVGCGQGGGAQDHSSHEGMAGMDMPNMDMPPTTKAGQRDTSLDAALHSPNAFVVADVRTVTLRQDEMPMELEANGVINYDPRGTRSVSARTAGWIEKLHVKYRYQPVKQGQPLMDLYSRELVTEQENYLFLIHQDPKDSVMIIAVEKRLALLGLTDDQITQLRSTGSAMRSVTYFSPVTGHLHENDRAEATSVGSMPMSGASDESLSLREGAYVEKGKTLFTIYGTGSVLALLSVHPNDGQDKIVVGQRVSVQIDGVLGGTIDGQVSLVEPVYQEGTPYVSVRVYLSNTGDSLRIGSRVTAVIHAAARSVRTIPISAVVSTGLHQYVFIKVSGGYRARMISTGTRSRDRVEVRSGIGPLEAIAENAQLLIDSESFLKATSQ